MSSLQIHVLPLLKDNYAYLLHSAGQTAVVDPSTAAPVLKALEEKRWRLTHIFNTHHHWDHTDGNLELRAATGAQVVGYAGDAKRIRGIDVTLQDNEVHDFGNVRAQVLFIPGHTLGHIAHYFEAEKALFCGDTLFSLGCGRLFEGTPEQMYHSLCRLAALPDDTRIYCGHEYTAANGRFARMLDPDNHDLQRRLNEVDALRKQGLPTIPAILGVEKKINPFLCTENVQIHQYLNMLNENNIEVFAALRRLKDDFK